MYINIRDRATRAAKWSVLGQWTTRAVQFLLLIFMARVLSPGEYGIFELVVLVLTLAQILQDFGLSRALIQTQLEINLASNIIFWANIILSIIVYAIIALLSPSVAQLFSEETVAPVLRIASLQLIFLSFRSVHLAQAHRRLLYQQQFLAEICGSVALVLSVIVLYIIGLRLWAFIYGLLIGSFTQTVVYWLINPWRPSLRIEKNWAEYRHLLRFGGLAAIESFQGWLLNYGDNLVVGYFLGVEVLGVYALAFNIAVNGFAVLLLPFSSIAYASFSNLQSNIAEIRRAFLNILRVAAMAIVPIGIGLVLTAEQLVDVILVDEWVGIVVVLQLLALFPGGISHLSIINPELYKAIGRPDVMPKLLLVALVLSFPIYILGAQFDLMGFVIARVFVTVIFFPVQIILVSRYLQSSVIQYWRRIKFPILAALVMIVFGIAFDITISHNISLALVRLVLKVLLCAGIYSIVLYWIDKENLLKAVDLFRKAI